MLRYWSQVIVGALALGLLGCSAGGGSSDLTNNNTGGGVAPPFVPTKTYTAETRMTALTGLGAVLANVAAADSATQNTELVTALANSTDIGEVGTTNDDCVWFRMADGQYALIVNNRPLTIPPAGMQARETTARPRPLIPVPGTPGPPPTANVTLPASTSALLLDAIDSSFDEPVVPKGGRPLIPAGQPGAAGPAVDATASISSGLSDKGYQPTNGETSVEGFRQVKGHGVFYLSAQAGYGGLKQKAQAQSRPLIPAGKTDPADRVFYAIWTSTPCNTANDALYAAEIAAGDLVYMCAPARRAGAGFSGAGRPLLPGAGDTTLPKPEPIVYSWHYGVTESFIQKHWTFAKDAIVYLDAANSEVIADACRAKGAAAVAYTPGYSSHPMARRGAAYFFDRVLGMNSYQTMTPAQRPFSAREAIHPQGIYPYSVKAGQADYAMLTPAIYVVEASEDTRQGDPSDTLTVIGCLGDTAGTVTMNGNALTVREWHATYAICDLPTTGAQAAGEVQVNVNEHKSNGALLTEWNGTAKFRATGPGSLGLNTDWTLHFRRDVRGYRSTCDSAVETGWKLPLEYVNDSRANFSASGTANTDGAITQFGPDGGPLPFNDTQPGNAAKGTTNVSLYLRDGPMEGRLWVYLSIIHHTIWKQGDMVIYSGDWPNLAPSLCMPCDRQPAQGIMAPGEFDLQVQPNWTITGSKRIKAYDPGTFPASVSLEWSTMTPKHAPTEQTPR